MKINNRLDAHWNVLAQFTSFQANKCVMAYPPARTDGKSFTATIDKYRDSILTNKRVVSLTRLHSHAQLIFITDNYIRKQVTQELRGVVGKEVALVPWLLGDPT